MKRFTAVEIGRGAVEAADQEGDPLEAQQSSPGTALARRTKRRRLPSWHSLEQTLDRCQRSSSSRRTTKAGWWAGAE